MNTEIILRFSYTEADYLAAIRLYYARVRRLLIALDPLIGALVLTVGAAGYFLAGPGWLFLSLMALGAACLLVEFVASFLIPYIRFHRAPRFRGEYEVKFDENGIELRTPSEHLKQRWSFYRRLVEDADTFLLLCGTNEFVFIPKRVFADGGEEDAFRELATAGISGNLRPHNS